MSVVPSRQHGSPSSLLLSSPVHFWGNASQIDAKLSCPGIYPQSGPDLPGPSSPVRTGTLCFQLSSVSPPFLLHRNPLASRLPAV